MKKALSLTGKSKSIIKKRVIYADMVWGTDFQLRLLRDPTRSPHRENYILEQLVKAQDPLTLQRFKKTTDKLINDFGRYNELSFSNISYPICPLSSSFLPEFDIDNHQNISQLLESFLWKINPLKQQRIQFHQISHLWPICLNNRIIRLQPSGQTLLSC